MKGNSKIFYISMGVVILFMISFLFLNMKGMDQFISSADENSIASIEGAIRKASIQCYALEGGYPPDIHYLRDNYGIIVNEKDYFYYYEVVASNIMPEIKVIKK